MIRRGRDRTNCTCRAPVSQLRSATNFAPAFRSLAAANFLQVAREKKSATRWAAFSIMQYAGNSLTAIQLPAWATVLVFVFPQSVSERPTFSKLKRCIFC